MGYLKVTNKFWQSDVCTGFGNRIPHWALAYKISEHHDFKFTILLDSFYWPETTYVDFPHTESTFLDIINKRKIKHFTDSESTTQVTHYDNVYGEFIDIVPDESVLELDPNKNYYITGDGLNKISASEPTSDGKEGIFWLPSAYKLLTLKSSSLELQIKNKVKDAIGVHVRKNNVTSPNTLEEVHKNSEELYEEYEKIDYLSIFSELVKDYDDQLLYISSDIATSFCSFNGMSGNELKALFPNYSEFMVTQKIYEKYNCIDYTHICPVSFPKGVLNDNNTLIPGEATNILYFKKILRDVIDLYSLLYCRDFVAARSTWSDFVYWYRGEL